MGFFKKEDLKEEKNSDVTNEMKIEVKEAEDSIKLKRRNLSICDVDTIQYIIKNFPDVSIDIQDGLINLSDILEKTINHIEDKSSELVKEDRNFELSQSYRDTSIAVYRMVKNIKEYVLWMKDEYEKNSKKEDEKKNDTLIENQEEEKKIENVEEISKSSEEIAIFNDFSGKEPKAFILRDDIVKVDDWNDLLVKTAEVLNKKYKSNKYSNKVVGTFDIVDEKSSQNEFRDTTIEMLNEYKISLDQFKVIVK